MSMCVIFHTSKHMTNINALFCSIYCILQTRINPQSDHIYDFRLTDDKMCVNKSFNIIEFTHIWFTTNDLQQMKTILFFHFTGVSPDPAVHSNLHPRWCHEAHHPSGPEPSTAPVWPEELRVYLLYPGERVQCHCTALQQHQHTVSEDHGKINVCYIVLGSFFFLFSKEALVFAKLRRCNGVISCNYLHYC